MDHNRRKLAIIVYTHKTFSIGKKLSVLTDGILLIIFCISKNLVLNLLIGKSFNGSKFCIVAIKYEIHILPLNTV